MSLQEYGADRVYPKQLPPISSITVKIPEEGDSTPGLILGHRGEELTFGLISGYEMKENPEQERFSYIMRATLHSSSKSKDDVDYGVLTGILDGKRETYEIEFDSFGTSFSATHGKGGEFGYIPAYARRLMGWIIDPTKDNEYHKRWDEKTENMSDEEFRVEAGLSRC